METGLFGRAMAKFLGGIVLMGLLLFLPAGTFRWWQAWLLLGILFIPMFGAGLVMQLVYSLIRFEPRDIRHRDVFQVTKLLLKKDKA